MLETLDRWIDETPPVDQPSRFGNKAYRTWYAKLDQVSIQFVTWSIIHIHYTFHFFYVMYMVYY